MTAMMVGENLQKVKIPHRENTGAKVRFFSTSAAKFVAALK
jgi:hypothetical protein